MNFRPDMTVREVPAPFTLRCRSGHVAPELFRRTGTKGPEEPTKFFRVSSDTHPEVDGVYCEPCLIVANAMAGPKRR